MPRILDTPVLKKFPRRPYGSRTEHFRESVIRGMSRAAVERGAINLAQGFPDFGAPDTVKEAAARAIVDNFNQYADPRGITSLREAIAARHTAKYGDSIDPSREITVCCGATEGLMDVLLAITDPGDEVLIFDPRYESYGPAMLLCGVVPKYVKLHPPNWKFDPAELRSAFSARTKAIIVTDPHNPTGRAFTREELQDIVDLCEEFDVFAITDEIYDEILYCGATHVPLITLPGMRDRTLLINGMSKTYAVTGWRIGWVLAAPHLTDQVRKVHDFLTVGAPTPLQWAGVAALRLPVTYYSDLKREYARRRELFLGGLRDIGFECCEPSGAYYIMANIAGFGRVDSEQFARHLVEAVGVAGVPGSTFFANPADGRDFVRFCFCKKLETLQEALARLRRV